MVTTLNYASITFEEVLSAKLRLEASVYNVEARKAKEVLKDCKWEVVKLWGKDGLIQNAFYPGRFKRIYVEKGNGYPMLLPAQMMELMPQPTKYISEKTFKAIANLKVQENTLLITRSGTIGNCTIVSRWLNGLTMSDDIIRVKFKENCDVSFTYTFLQTEIGRTILQTNNYGSVIQHIEPEHLQEVDIPKPPIELREKIHLLITQSFELRDKSNELVQQAEDILIRALKLPPIDNIRSEYFEPKASVKTFIVPLDELNNRFDGSYHDPIVGKLLDYFFDAEAVVKPLSAFVTKITMPGIFKRIYVGKEEGVAFLGTTDVRQLSPKIDKYLSKKAHKRLIERELSLQKNTILQFNRGSVSVGEVVFVPEYFQEEDWTASQNCLRIIPKEDVAGYLFIFLNSDYGNALSRREIYGAVIDMIDPTSAKQIPIPMLNDEKKVKEINDLALEANRLRTEAYNLEKQAIATMNNEVLYA